MNIMEKRNTELIREFNRYVREHPDFSESIPNNSIVIMQLEGDDVFNKWSLELAKCHSKEKQPIVCVRIKKIKPIRSRIEELEIERQVIC